MKHGSNTDKNHILSVFHPWLLHSQARISCIASQCPSAGEHQAIASIIFTILCLIR